MKNKIKVWIGKHAAGYLFSYHTPKAFKQLNCEVIESIKEPEDYDLAFFQQHVVQNPITKDKPAGFWIADPVELGTLERETKVALSKNVYNIFSSSMQLAEKYKQFPLKNVWRLPMAVDPELFYPIEVKEIYDTGLVGYQYPERRKFYSRLQKEGFKLYLYDSRTNRPYSFKELNTILNTFKIHTNVAPTNSLNMRVFEGMACKKLIIGTKKGDEDLFEEDKNIVLYSSLDDAVNRLRYYLENEKERRKIAEAGYREVLSNHTYQNRMKYVIEKLMETK